jgi:hypothetical protein
MVDIDFCIPFTLGFVACVALFLVVFWFFRNKREW